MIKKLLSKIPVVFLAVCPGLTGYSMLFSLVAAPQVHATVNDYWDEPLAVADNSCVLIPLNEGSGTTFYGQDTNSLYAFTGSFRSSGSAAWISAVHGNGLSFDGDSDQGVNVAQNGVLSLTDEDATWEFWFKLNQTLSRDQVVAQVGSAWQIKVRNNGQICLSANHGGTWRWVETPSSISVGEWIHVLFTRECTNQSGGTADYLYTVYINGELSGIDSFASVSIPSSSTGNMTLGYSVWDTSHLDGCIDDFRISRGISRRQALFEDNEEVFQNPHMGFAYATDPLKYLTLERYDSPENPPEEFQVIKLIIEWADVEPSPGQYDWDEVDEAIDLLTEKGHSINARFVLTNGKTTQGVPDWIYDSPYNVGYIDVDNNCKGIGPTRHPYYWDANFQARATNILARFADRYSTNDLSWIDVRIYGHAGEWDAGNNPFPWEDFPSQNKSNTLHQLVDIYIDQFADTDIPVAINPAGWEYDSACHIPVYSNQPLSHFLGRLALGHAYDNGFGIRMDDVRGWPGWEPSWTTEGVLDLYADSRFAVGETGNGWDPVTDPPSNVVNNALSLKMTSIAYGGHRSQGLNFVTNYPAEYQLGMKNLGYRLLPTAVTYPSIIQTGQVYSIDVIWENLAVGRLIKDNYQLRAYLKAPNGTIYWQRSDTSFDPTQIVNGNDFDPADPDGWHDDGEMYPIHHGLSRIHATTQRGTHDLYIAIVRDDDLTPEIRLPIDGDDGNLRYYIGQVTVTE